MTQESEFPSDFLLCPKESFSYVDLRKRSFSHPSLKDPLCKSTVFQAMHRVLLMANISIDPHLIRKLAASYGADMMGTSKSLVRVLMDRRGYKSELVLEMICISIVSEFKFRWVAPSGTYSPSCSILLFLFICINLFNEVFVLKMNIHFVN